MSAGAERTGHPVSGRGRNLDVCYLLQRRTTKTHNNAKLRLFDIRCHACLSDVSPPGKKGTKWSECSRERAWTSHAEEGEKKTNEGKKAEGDVTPRRTTPATLIAKHFKQLFSSSSQVWPSSTFSFLPITQTPTPPPHKAPFPHSVKSHQYIPTEGLDSLKWAVIGFPLSPL